MGIEGRAGAPQPSAEDAYAEADPTTVSPLPLQGPLEYVGYTDPVKRYGIYSDGQDRYVQLPEDAAERQQVVARLLKGIVSVADVVAKTDAGGTRHFSKIMPHERIADHTSNDEIYADIELMRLIFNDTDRSYSTKDDYMGELASNLKVEDGKATYYDFGSAEFNIDAPMKPQRREGNRALDILAQKVDLLVERFQGEEGKRHFLSIIEQSGKQSWELFRYSEASDSAESLYKGFLKRLAKAQEYLESERQALEFKKSA